MRYIAAALVVSAIFVCLPMEAEPGLNMGISIDEDGLRSFHLAVGDYFGAPEAQIAVVTKSIPDEDMPVVFFIAARAGVLPAVIVDLRLGGMSWMDISLRYGITAEAYYVDVDSGPPYGKAYGYYKKPKNQWKTLVFSDADVVNLVNLRFISEHYGLPPIEVMSMRDGGESFVTINTKAKDEKHASKGKDKGKGKGKKK